MWADHACAHGIAMGPREWGRIHCVWLSVYDEVHKKGRVPRPLLCSLPVISTVWRFKQCIDVGVIAALPSNKVTALAFRRGSFPFSLASAEPQGVG